MFISFRSLYEHLPYHKTVLQRLPLFCKIHTNLASSENFVLLIDFTILDVLIFGSRVFFLTYIFKFRPLKQLILIG